MFPYRDDNPTLKTPWVTGGIMALTTVAWIVVQGAGSNEALARSVCEFGAIPGELLRRLAEGTQIPMGPGMSCTVGGSPHWYTVVSSLFMHGSWLHLIGNMWFLWIFGNNVEDSMGHGRFFVFYFLCGVIAACTQVFASPTSAVPMVGASGAISGVMGAYLVLYPKVRVHMLVFLVVFVTTITVPAYLMLAYWFALQAIQSLPALGDVSPDRGGVAFLAHVGGFIAGAALIKAFARPELVAAHRRVTGGQVFNEPWQRGSGWE